eukprot:7386596-Prymnesium_polylepis.2
MAASSTPIHCAMPCHRASQLVVGIKALPMLSSVRRPSSGGYEPRIWPPLTAPPITNVCPPQP